MARVYPGEDFRDIYDIRGIYSSNLQDDDYKVRRTANDMNLDRRSNSYWQEQVIDKLSLASRIYKNKKPCWQDHFKRSSKRFSYANHMDEDLFRILTGYKLSINVLMNSLSNMDGNFYDPDCFCITPCDLFGDPMNMYSILDIDMSRIVRYRYNEKKLTFDGKQPEANQLDKFCSAIDGKDLSPEKIILTTQGCVQRNNSRLKYRRNLGNVKNIVQWFDIWFDPVDDFVHGKFGIWNTDYFSYQKVDESDLPVQDGSMRGVVITLGPKFTGTNLCSLGNLNMTIFYSPTVFTGTIQHTNSAPYLDIYYGDSYQGRFGAGAGEIQHSDLNLSQDYLTTPSSNFILWDYSIYPVVKGYQPSMYPPGKLQEARLVETYPAGEKTGDCMWDGLYQDWEVKDPVTLVRYAGNVLFKLNIWGYTYSTQGYQTVSPYGAFELYASQDGDFYEKVHAPSTEYRLDGSSSSFCWGGDQLDNLLNGEYKYFRTHLYTTYRAIWKDYAGTMFGDRKCQPCEMDSECFKPCNNQRGLFILETAKEFEVRPVACRCPENGCPGKFPEFGVTDCTRYPISPCPENPSKVLLGDECYDCVGPNKIGLVYDLLQ